MATSRTVLTLCFLVAFLGSIGSISETAYGDDVYSGGSGGSLPSDDVLSGENSSDGGLIGDFVGALLGFASSIINPVIGFFTSFLPNPTGIWVIDDLIINPLTVYMGYVALATVLSIPN